MPTPGRYWYYLSFPKKNCFHFFSLRVQTQKNWGIKYFSILAKLLPCTHLHLVAWWYRFHNKSIHSKSDFHFISRSWAFGIRLSFHSEAFMSSCGRGRPQQNGNSLDTIIHLYAHSFHLTIWLSTIQDEK